MDIKTSIYGIYEISDQAGSPQKKYQGLDFRRRRRDLLGMRHFAAGFSSQSFYEADGTDKLCCVYFQRYLDQEEKQVVF